MATTNGHRRTASELEVATKSRESATIFAQPLPPNWRDLIGQDPHRPGEDRVRVLGPGIAVWAIVGHLRALGDEFTPESIARAADDFKIPVTAVTAALAYYLEHREAIDARLTVNAAAVA